MRATVLASGETFVLAGGPCKGRWRNLLRRVFRGSSLRGLSEYRMKKKIVEATRLLMDGMGSEESAQVEEKQKEKSCQNTFSRKLAFTEPSTKADSGLKLFRISCSYGSALWGAHKAYRYRYLPPQPTLSPPHYCEYNLASRIYLLIIASASAIFALCTARGIMCNNMLTLCRSFKSGPIT